MKFSSQKHSFFFFLPALLQHLLASAFACLDISCVVNPRIILYFRLILPCAGTSSKNPFIFIAILAFFWSDPLLYNILLLFMTGTNHLDSFSRNLSLVATTCMTIPIVLIVILSRRFDFIWISTTLTWDPSFLLTSQHCDTHIAVGRITPRWISDLSGRKVFFHTGLQKTCHIDHPMLTSLLTLFECFLCLIKSSLDLWD